MLAAGDELPKPPAELLEIKPRRGDGSRWSPHFCEDLCCYGGRDDFTWGLRKYRTVYSHGSDADFEKAMTTLEAYQNFECFEDVVRKEKSEEQEDDDDIFAYTPGIDDSDEEEDEEEMNENDNSDTDGDTDEEDKEEEQGEVIYDKANQQLRKKLRNEIILDPSLEGASWAQLKQNFRQWIASRRVQESESSRYRFFVVVDEEVLRKLVRLPMPGTLITNPDKKMYSVKVFDVEFEESHTRLEHAETFHPSVAACLAADKGWCWAAAWRLMQLWFVDRAIDGYLMRFFDKKGRPYHSNSDY